MRRDALDERKLGRDALLFSTHPDPWKKGWLSAVYTGIRERHGRQRGRLVRAPHLKTAVRRSRVQIPFWPLADVVLGSPEFNFSATLVNSQLVCLPPVGILNLVMFISVFIYYCLFTLVVKSPNGEWPMTYTCTYTIEIRLVASLLVYRLYLHLVASSHWLAYLDAENSLLKSKQWKSHLFDLPPCRSFTPSRNGFSPGSGMAL